MIKSQSDIAKCSLLIQELEAISPKERPNALRVLIRKYTKNDGSTFSKSEILSIYEKKQNVSPDIVIMLRKKPIRSLSGVTPITLLTEPYPCPGKCIFCPSDIRMPKSYIASEPGAQRAGQYAFHPYAQMYNRLLAFKETGHPTSKIEIIILGGTWSVYPESYQLWFISQTLRALNDFGDNIDNRPVTKNISLEKKYLRNETYNQYISEHNKLDINKVATWEEVIFEQRRNETNACRCVGLVLETRPDQITQKEIVRLRKLGATKIQIGIQSLSDEVLKLNQRGHTVSVSINAIALLRSAGFKLHCHWMPNLYGSDPDKDIADFQSLFKEDSICPDELKVYPCSLVENTELMTKYESGKWLPYTQQELTYVLHFVLTHTPEYCRLTRIVRDIPGTEIVAGNKYTNIRQMIETPNILSQAHDIRAREIKNNPIDPNSILLDDVIYRTPWTTEHFLQFITMPDRKIVGFLRLSLPGKESYISELKKSAIIREIHIYGQSVTLGHSQAGASQHRGYGKQLIQKAANIAREHSYTDLAVISAMGTREYYRDNQFVDGDLYQHLSLKQN